MSSSAAALPRSSGVHAEGAITAVQSIQNESQLHNGGFQCVLDQVVLPLGLSFSTFHKIALLVASRAGASSG